MNSIEKYNMTISNYPEATFLSDGLLKFIKDINSLFEKRIADALFARAILQNELNHGLRLHITEPPQEHWKVAPIPDDMKVRRVEITGPASDTKMVINALNSGAHCYMADFEDSMSPTWENVVQAHSNIIAAVDGIISLETNDKAYKLNKHTAKLMMRPRGLHLKEERVKVEDTPVNAMIFDLAIFTYLNAQKFIDRGETIALYIPKLENANEAKLVNDILTSLEKALLLPENCIRTTILCETYPMIFELESALWELKDRALGINFGRYDFIFSMIKKIGNTHMFPPKSKMTMESPFLMKCAERIVEVCQRHEAQPIGGMSANLPVKGDHVEDVIARVQIRRDKMREAKQGFIGAWIAHPQLKDIVNDIFEYADKKELEPAVDLHLLNAVPAGYPTYQELCDDIRTMMEYLYNWFKGKGAVSINNKMEDLATAEINRMLLTNWRHHKMLCDGELLDDETLEIAIDQEHKNLLATGRFEDDHMLNWTASHFLFTFIKDQSTQFMSELVWI